MKEFHIRDHVYSFCFQTPASHTDGVYLFLQLYHASDMKARPLCCSIPRLIAGPQIGRFSENRAYYMMAERKKEDPWETLLCMEVAQNTKVQENFEK